ncbi:MAG TPA: enoyl-CoA hydratase-related protein [Haliangiales bacterium]|nr:enoyl-CoA hydratase-related protein [Haliangiales bacterium]
MANDDHGVSVRDDGMVRWIILDRPQSKNGLTVEVNARIIDGLASAGDDIRVVAIFGAGGAFCSGLDLKNAMATAGGAQASAEDNMRRYFHGLIRAVRACPKPVVAVVDGAAVGYGCDLALACDIRFCSDRARFGEIFIKRGLMPDGGGTFHLARIVGLGRALELMLTGEMVDAAEAYRIGLANKIVPAADVEAAARDYLARLAAGAPLVHRAVKEHVYGALAGDLDAALENEVRGQMRLLQSQDFFEGVAAFLGKRPPEFKGR